MIFLDQSQFLVTAYRAANNFFTWKDICPTKTPSWSDKTKLWSDVTNLITVDFIHRCCRMIYDKIFVQTSCPTTFGISSDMSKFWSANGRWPTVICSPEHSNQWDCFILYRQQITSYGLFSCLPKWAKARFRVIEKDVPIHSETRLDVKVLNGSINGWFHKISIPIPGARFHRVRGVSTYMCHGLFQVKICVYSCVHFQGSRKTISFFTMEISSFTLSL